MSDVLENRKASLAILLNGKTKDDSSIITCFLMENPCSVCEWTICQILQDFNPNCLLFVPS